MASFLVIPHQISLLVFLHILLLSSPTTSQPPNPNTICNNTPHPEFCKSVLTKNKQAKSIHDYGRFTISQSLSMTNDFLSLVNRHLQSSKYGQSLFYALEDCQFLASLSTEYLSSTARAIGSSDTLGTANADDVQTMLSAILTNLDTCNDELQSALQSGSSGGEQQVNDLTSFVKNESMLYSVSLALFTHGWVPKSRHGKGRQLYDGHPFLQSGYFFMNRKVDPSGYYLPLKLDQMVNYNHGGESNNHGRKLLQLGDMGIVVNKTVVVNPDGSGNFTTITDAIASAPNNTKSNTSYYGIYVVAGVYEEYVVVPSNKKYLLLYGDGINQTIITGNRSVGGNWTTFNSASFATTSLGFVAVNITFRNTAGPAMHQAVALRSGADLSAFYRCSFEAYQDTLYTHSMRQFYKECDIYGTVDFIFGNAAVVLQDCNIYSRQPMKGQYNPITAQGRTDPNQNTGTSIHNCNILATDDLISSNFTVRTYLGRPWKEYSRTVYMETFMDSLIEPAGWREWSGTFALDTLYYAEYNNTGPGSNTTNRVTWTGYHPAINETEASSFTVSNFIVGDYWLPSTGIPYTGGFN